MKSKVRIKKKPDQAIRTLNKIAKQMRGAESVVAGLPKESNNYPDGTSVIMVGAVHEFGSDERNIPERSYLRTTIRENKTKYRNLLKKLAKLIAKGKITNIKALNILGLQLQKDIRDKITDIDSPPLQYRDGNPLVDTGHLRQVITYLVNE